LEGSQLKREIDLSDDECEAILRTAELWRQDYYLFIELNGEARGLRTGEIVGVEKTTFYYRWLDKHHHEKGREKVPSVTSLPGIHVDDLREGAVWLQRKGGIMRKTILPKWLYARLVDYSRTLKKQPHYHGVGEARTACGRVKLFGFWEDRAYDIVKECARRAGMKDWDLMHPHRLRHYFITRAHRRFRDLKTTQDLAGHSSERTTLRYIAKLTPEEESAKLEELSPAAGPGL
jgi:integrase